MLKRIFDRKTVVRSLAIRARALEISRNETISLFDAQRIAEHEQKQDNAIRAVIADIEIGTINKNKLQLISKDGRRFGRNSY